MTTPQTARAASRLAEADSVVVLGLGRFGSALANELMRVGVEVLGVDKDPAIVQAHASELTSVVQADTTSETALRQLGVPEFDRAVVGIGNDIEASLLTAALLVQFNVGQVWAKAITDAHGRILEQLGVGHVVFPEVDMGRRVAHLVRGAMLDYVPFDDDFAMVRTKPPREGIGVPLQQAQLRKKYGVTVIAVRTPGSGWTYATADTVLGEADEVIVTGPTRKAERFALLD
ncbi:MAG: TrkA family potassium uptake protein [Solirubrobacteraceae bacterium]|nr:TrkA family potassium uptake protein [Solirubrobacteraceae bacterium]